MNAGQPAGVAVAVAPRLARAADADEFAVVVPGVIAVRQQAVQVLILQTALTRHRMRVQLYRLIRQVAVIPPIRIIPQIRMIH